MAPSSWGAPATHVLDVTGRAAQDFETIARRYAAQPNNQRSLGNWLRQFAQFMMAPLRSGFNLDPSDRELRRPFAYDRGLLLASTAAFEACASSCVRVGDLYGLRLRVLRSVFLSDTRANLLDGRFEIRGLRSLRQNSRYKNGTTKACSIVFSVVPYRALQSDRCLVITT